MTIKSKHLYSITENKGNIKTQLQYNTNTNHITICNEFTLNKNNYKLKSINKESPNYLGINCAEQVLSKVFKNVKMMPYGNPGFDFKCSNGYKVDSKAACKNKRDNNWIFAINKNKIPDYFALLAFDNRNDINPLYFWLIPGYVVNDKIRISISQSTLSKWNGYKQDISKVIKCCDNIKSND